MQHLGDLLAKIPVQTTHEQAGGDANDASARSVELVTNLGAGLPEGQLHLWGGPDGAGKTSFLLSLLSGAAGCSRRVLYATYDLPAASLARRLLAMTAGVSPSDLPDPGGTTKDSPLDAEAWARVDQAHRYLSGLPFSFIEARGLSVDSLRDRLARMPFRANVMAIDYLQAVVRDRDIPLKASLRNLTELAKRMHVAIVCAVRPDADVMKTEGKLGVHPQNLTRLMGKLPDRVGWLAPAGDENCVAGEENCLADVVMNRHGPQTSMPLRVRSSGALEPRA